MKKILFALTPLFAPVLAAVFLLTGGAGLQAHHGHEPARVGEILVSHAWTQERAAVADAMNVYMTIENQGETTERLVAASASFASAGVFEMPMRTESGAFALREISAIVIEPGQRVTLQPGSAHIQLTDVQRHFHAGDHFHMTLAFETAGEISISVDVERMSEEHDHEQPAS